MRRWLRQIVGLERADLVPRWKAFIEKPAAKGEPTIRPANVPNVKPLKGRKESWVEWWETQRRRRA